MLLNMEQLDLIKRCHQNLFLQLSFGGGVYDKTRCLQTSDAMYLVVPLKNQNLDWDLINSFRHRILLGDVIIRYHIHHVKVNGRLNMFDNFSTNLTVETVLAIHGGMI